jgi:hypothetical protein
MPIQPRFPGFLTLGLCLAACGSEAGPPANEENAAVVTTQAATAQTFNEVAPESRPSGGVLFKSVLALNQTPPPGEIQLRNGFIANSKEWQASLYATFETPRGTSACTAALVGPQAVLTAAHCTPEDGVIAFEFPGASQPYKADCKISERYPKDASADFALCKVRSVVATPAGFEFETVSTGNMDLLLPSKPNEKKPLVLAGFGCISDVAVEDDTDGLYRLGFNTPVETSNSKTKKRGAGYYVPAERNNLIMGEGPDVANLCPGDSGGPAFAAKANAKGRFGSRSIVGVNSRVFYRDETRKTYGASLISATGGPDLRPLFDQFAGSLAVCGLGGGVQNCRR